jgi:hypothetical protein
MQKTHEEFNKKLTSNRFIAKASGKNFRRLQNYELTGPSFFFTNAVTIAVEV